MRKQILDCQLKTCRLILEELGNKGFNHSRFSTEHPGLHDKYRNLITISNGKGGNLDRLSHKAMSQLAELVGLKVSHQFTIEQIKDF